MKMLLVALGIAALSTGAMAQNVGGSVLFNADNGHFYQMFTNSSGLSWDSASTYAISQGGYLATVTSSVENSVMVQNFVSSYIPELANGQYYSGIYLGASDSEVEGVWKWVTGEEWSYTNWRAGEPNNDGSFGQDYLQYVTAGYYGFNNNWDDVWGDDRYKNGVDLNMRAFIVEYNSNPTAPGNNAVPEPSEWAAMGLLGAGLLGLVVKGRKKNLAN